MDRIDRVLSDLPSDILTTDQDIISGYTTDHRRQYHGRTYALLRPRTTEEVQQIVRACAANRVGLVPQGGNTSYCAGATPSESGDELLLSLERMTAAREIDAANLSITVDAGMILSELQEIAATVDRKRCCGTTFREWSRSVRLPILYWDRRSACVWT